VLCRRDIGAPPDIVSIRKARPSAVEVRPPRAFANRIPVRIAFQVVPMHIPCVPHLDVLRGSVDGRDTGSLRGSGDRLAQNPGNKIVSSLSDKGNIPRSRVVKVESRQMG
jgi:hypothetical protein